MKILLPSLLEWCRQCDQNGHIDYSAIPCGRCAANHQTSACPITIMGVCIYCSAIGMHFSQLCVPNDVSIISGINVVEPDTSNKTALYRLLLPRRPTP